MKIKQIEKYERRLFFENLKLKNDVYILSQNCIGNEAMF